MSSDAELLRAVAAHDERAFEQLFRRYRAAVHRLCAAMLRDAADDCLQETFLRVWRKAPLYRAQRDSAKPWLLTVGRNVARNLIPRHVVAPAAETAAEPQQPKSDALYVRAALAQLPARERRVLVLAYYGGRSQAEIAAELGVPLGSVKTWSRRGLERLAATLEER